LLLANPTAAAGVAPDRQICCWLTGVFAQYYGLQWLSLRDATWHEIKAELPGYKTTLPDNHPPEEDGITFYWDYIHPHGKTGHR
jgi:hypothetical protein